VPFPKGSGFFLPLFIYINMEVVKKYQKLERVNQELIHLAQLGDVTALNKLLVNNKPVIRNFLSGKLFNDKSDLDDLVQESMIKLATGLHGYDHTRPFIRYVFQLSNQVFIDYLRDIRASQPIEGEPDSESLLSSCLDDDFIQEEFIYNLKEKVKVAISEFKNDEMKKVMMMNIFEQLTYTEIVEQTGLSMSYVKANLSRGKKILKNNLALTGK